MRFPLFALVAPIISSVILWLVTGSPFVLLFAAMGPLMAGANYLDARRTAKAQQATRAEEQQLAEAQAEHSRRVREKDALSQAVAAHPPISSVVNAGELERPPWCIAEPPGAERSIRVGADVASGLPALIDTSARIALVGSGIMVASAERAVRAALHWGWGSSEPKRRDLDALVQTYSVIGMVPPRTRWVVSVNSDGTAAVADMANPAAAPQRIHVDLLTHVETQQVSELITRHASQLAIPSGVTLSIADLSLPEHGPHAVVAGMTGSGKTEFLVAWLLAMMQETTPAELNVMILDFKGGLGFARLTAFPHVVGMVTDLTPELGQRCLRSLRAEIRFREALLAQRGVVGASELPVGVLPRLVIIVDEYRALLEAAPEAAAVFADLTARGRALGIHVILATQHTGGVFSEAILANCALRVCFRVTNSHDSRTLLGDDRATQLSHQPGQAIVLGSGLAASALQVDPVDDHRLYAASVAAQAWVATHPAVSIRRPWLDPLPNVLEWSQLPALGSLVAGVAADSSGAFVLTFGLSDNPDAQSQPLAVWHPEREGHLLVSGPVGSGRTTVVHTLAHAAKTAGADVVIAADAVSAWDVVVNPPSQGIVLLDNLESITATYGHEHRDAFIQALQALLREGAGRGIFVAAATLDHGAVFAQLQNLMRSRLQMGPNPGLGFWCDLPTRIATTPGSEVRGGAQFNGSSPETSAPPVSWDDNASYLVVTHRPEQFIARLPAPAASRTRIVTAAANTTPTTESAIYVGDVDDWQSAYNLLTTLRRTALIVFEDCTPSEVRALRLSRGLLPYAPPGTSILLHPSGEAQRVRISES